MSSSDPRSWAMYSCSCRSKRGTGRPCIVGMFSRSATEPSRNPRICATRVGELSQYLRKREFQLLGVRTDEHHPLAETDCLTGWHLGCDSEVCSFATVEDVTDSRFRRATRSVYVSSDTCAASSSMNTPDRISWDRASSGPVSVSVGVECGQSKIPSQRSSSRIHFRRRGQVSVSRGT